MICIQYLKFRPQILGPYQVAYTYQCAIAPIGVGTRKKNASPIFTVPFNYAKFGIDSGTVKIGVTTFFLGFKPNKAYILP